MIGSTLLLFAIYFTAKIFFLPAQIHLLILFSKLELVGLLNFIVYLLLYLCSQFS